MTFFRFCLAMLICAMFAYGVENGEWYIDKNSPTTFCYKDDSRGGKDRKQAMLDKFNAMLFPDEDKRGKLHKMTNTALSKGYDTLKKFGFMSSRTKDLCFDYEWATFGKVKSVNGKVLLSKSEPMPPVSYFASENDVIFLYDSIRTNDTSRISVDGDYVDYTLGVNSELHIEQDLKSDMKSTDMLKVGILEGVATFVSDGFCKINKNNCIFKTNTMALGIRGTAFTVDVRNNKERFYCLEGEIYVYPLQNPSDKLYINAGEYVEVDKRKSPIAPKTIPPAKLLELKRELLELKADDSFIKHELSDTR